MVRAITNVSSCRFYAIISKQGIEQLESCFWGQAHSNSNYNYANGHSLVGKFILFHFGLAQHPWYVNSIWCIYPTHLVHVAHNHTNKIDVV